MYNFEKIKLDEGFNLILLETEKFKTNYISAHILRPLKKEEVTMNSMLPYVLKSGSRNYPDQIAMTDELNDLYGSSFNVGVFKNGERQIMSFKLSLTNDKFLEDNILEEGIRFFNDIINNPLVEDGSFKDEFVSVEASNLRDAIRSRINDKNRYAAERLIENMCEGEAFSIYDQGYEEDLEKIDGRVLYDHYKNVMETSEIDIVVAGDFDRQRIIDTIKELFKIKRGEIVKIEDEKYEKEVESVKRVIDSMEVSQGKLGLGYRTNISYRDPNYYSLAVYASILGGGAHSKLFLNVREKESLCYYIYSSLEKYNGIMTIGSGIEIKNYDKALKLIEKEVEDMRLGNISQEEFENSKKSMINGLRSMTDSLSGIGGFVYIQGMRDINETPESIIEKIKKVSVQDVIDVAQNIKLDTVYFLRD